MSALNKYFIPFGAEIMVASLVAKRRPNLSLVLESSFYDI